MRADIFRTSGQDDDRRRAAGRRLGRLARELASQHRPARQPVDARRGGRLRPPGRRRDGPRAHRRRHDEGNRALPGLDAASRCSAVAGLLPQVDTIVSNAMSLHPVVPRLSKVKLTRVVPLVHRLLDYVDPHWGKERRPAVRRAAARRRGAADPPRVPQRRLRDGQLHVRRRAPRAVVAREPQRRTPRPGSARSSPGPAHLLRPDGALACRPASWSPTGSVPGMPADPVASAPRTDARFALIGGRGQPLLPPGEPGARPSTTWSATRRAATRCTSWTATATSTSSWAATPPATPSPLILQELADDAS